MSHWQKQDNSWYKYF